MRLFECQGCGNPVHFENSVCVSCGRSLGFLPDLGVLSALEQDEGGQLVALADKRRPVLYCDNAGFGACNWLRSEEEGPGLCRACRHNRTLPDLSVQENLDGWQRIEAAKHHLFYSLTRWGLETPTRFEDPEEGLAFDFLADQQLPDGGLKSAMTGHSRGLITIAVAEADDAERERRRTSMGEPYRTLLGHFRHEFGHWVWDRTVKPDDANLAAFRSLFGDERPDYDEALSAYYANGPAPDWRSRCVSAYATAHPWEDFAETFAHYVHMIDGLETARTYGLRVRPRVGHSDNLNAKVDFDPYAVDDVEPVVEAWIPFTVAMNAMNRSLGQPDLYPFVLSTPAVEKLGFVHDLLRTAAVKEGRL